MHDGPEITNPLSEFYQNAVGFAMGRYAYYQCFVCKVYTQHQCLIFFYFQISNTKIKIVKVVFLFVFVFKESVPWRNDSMCCSLR